MLSIERINDFYLLEAMKHSLSTAMIQERAKLKLKDRVEDALFYLTESLARAFYDYILVASSGEARHASSDKTNWYFIEDFYAQVSGGRQFIYQECKMFDPNKLREALVKVFEGSNWKVDGWGNESWQKIALTSQYYGKWPDGVFVDYCVDLHHNGGNMFSKPVAGRMDFDTRYLHNKMNWFLNLKRNHNILTYKIDRQTQDPHYITSTTLLLYKRWTLLNDVDTDNSLFEKVHRTGHNTFEYTPIQWGYKIPTVIRKYRKGVSIQLDELGNAINGKTVEKCTMQAKEKIHSLIMNHSHIVFNLKTWRDMKEYISSNQDKIAKEIHKEIIKSFRYCVVKGKERTKIRMELEKAHDVETTLRKRAVQTIKLRYASHKKKMDIKSNPNLSDRYAEWKNLFSPPDGFLPTLYELKHKLIDHYGLTSPINLSWQGQSIEITKEDLYEHGVLDKPEAQEIKEAFDSNVIEPESWDKANTKEVMPTETIDVTAYIEKVNQQIQQKEGVQNER